MRVTAIREHIGSKASHTSISYSIVLRSGRLASTSVVVTLGTHLPIRLIGEANTGSCVMR
jgi:hypothetical protein